MTSYEDNFKEFERTLDKEQGQRPPATASKPIPAKTTPPPSTDRISTTPTYVRTVGFSTSEKGETEPISIPGKGIGSRPTSASSYTGSSSHSPDKVKPSSSFQDEFKTYKSQLSGWSSDQSPSTSADAHPPTIAASPSRGGRTNTPVFPQSTPDIVSPSIAKRTRAPSTSSNTNNNNNVISSTPPSLGKPPIQQQGGQPPKAVGEAIDKSKMTKEERRLMYIQQGFTSQGGTKKGTKVPNAGGKPQQQQQQASSSLSTVSPALLSSTASPLITNSSAAPSPLLKASGDQPSTTGGNSTPTLPGPGGAAPGGGAAKPRAHKPAIMQFDDEKKRAKAEKKKILHLQPSQKRVALFAHLPQYDNLSSLKLNVGFAGTGQLHPAWLELGLKYAKRLIVGSNARCVAMLLAFKQVLSDFQAPSGMLFKDLDIKTMVQFLVDCRPLSISMGNAINYLKVAISETKKFSSVEQAKEYVCEQIDKFIQERIQVADEIISTQGASRINDDDVILTYAKSYAVELILKKAFDQGKKFRVVVVDSRPRKEGMTLLRSLVEHGLECTYIHINAISYIMKEVTKVFVGAYAMMANGYLISRVGTAVIGVMAKTYHVPFIVCCESYKFTERVQLESISFNELADPDELLKTDDEEDPQVLKNWKDNAHLKLLNLVYDLTPVEFIMAVITEVGMIPPTSVPVVLRVLYTMEN